MDGDPAGFASMERLVAAAAAPVPVQDPSVMKLTRGHSCVLCQQRKVRCDKQKPCANCVKAQVECRVVPPQPPRRRKKKPHERDLIERLKKYENLLSQHGVSFDPIGNDFKPPDGGPDDVADLEQDLSGLKTSSGTSAQDYHSGGSQEPEMSVPSTPLALSLLANSHFHSLHHYLPLPLPLPNLLPSRAISLACTAFYMRNSPNIRPALVDLALS